MRSDTSGLSDFIFESQITVDPQEDGDIRYFLQYNNY